MHSYRIQNRWLSLLTPEVVSLLTKIYEHRGKFSIRLEYEKLGLETSTMMATFHSRPFPGDGADIQRAAAVERQLLVRVHTV